MEEEKINAVSKYFGCECKYISEGTNRVGILSIGILYWLWSGSHIKNLELHLKPLSSLTQEDFDRMWGTLGYPADPDYNYYMNCINSHNADDDISFKEADWLRNHGYSLNEECIKEFVKLKS